MGISDKIEVATITIDEETILEIKATIALPFQLGLKTFVVHGMTATKLAKSALHVQIFLFFSLIFSFPSSQWLNRVSSVTLRKACNS